MDASFLELESSRQTALNTVHHAGASHQGLRRISSPPHPPPPPPHTHASTHTRTCCYHTAENPNNNKPTDLTKCQDLILTLSHLSPVACCRACNWALLSLMMSSTGPLKRDCMGGEAQSVRRTVQVGRVAGLHGQHGTPGRTKAHQGELRAVG